MELGRAWRKGTDKEQRELCTWHFLRGSLFPSRREALTRTLTDIGPLGHGGDKVSRLSLHLMAWRSKPHLAMFPHHLPENLV